MSTVRCLEILESYFRVTQRLTPEERPGQTVATFPLLMTKTLCYSAFDSRVN